MNRANVPLVALALVAAALLLIACTPSEEDEPYLVGFCAATIDFSAELAGAETLAALTLAVEAFRAELAALEPPSDLADFHADYLAYLDRLAADPTLEEEPPEPPDDVRRRLDSLSIAVDECAETGFFES